LKDEPYHRMPDASRIARSGEPWLLGAFLVFFGVAVAAAMPAVAGAVRSAMADAAGAAPGKTETAQRVVIRARFFVLPTVEPKAPAGHDLISPAFPDASIVVANAPVSPRRIDARALLSKRGFHARAPPHLSA